MGRKLSSTQYEQSKMMENPTLELLPTSCNQVTEEQPKGNYDTRDRANDEDMDPDEALKSLVVVDRLGNDYLVSFPLLTNIISKGYKDNVGKYSSINAKCIKSIDFLQSAGLLQETQGLCL